MATLNLNKKERTRVQAGVRFHFDYWLLLAIGALVIIGMLTVYSTTFDIGLQWKDDTTYYIRRQAIALFLGIGAFLFIMQFDYHILRRVSVPLLIITVGGLFAILFLGEVLLGSTRGLQGGSYSPSEVAKLTVILYIAHWLSSKGDRIKKVTYGLIPFSVITGVVCSLIVQQPDLSTATLIALVSFTLFFIAGADWRQFALAGILGGTVFTVLMLTFPHTLARFTSYREALTDPAKAGYQVQQTLAALGRGGWFGTGLGASTQKFIPLPAGHTDAAFAILAEELGMLGSLLVVGLFALLVWRGIRTAMNARDSYGALLAIGITCWLGYQTLLNIAVITALIPVTGIPLPFISYGGSSLAISLVGAGILLNISRDSGLVKRPQQQRRKQ